MIAKAEHLPKGANPRFIITSLPASAIDARTLYEEVYCARGQVEKAAARPVRRSHVSRHPARQPAPPVVRVVRLCPARCPAPDRAALHPVATATCGTIRLKLLKIGAQIRTSVRRIKVAMASACPYQDEYHLAYLALTRAAAF